MWVLGTDMKGSEPSPAPPFYLSLRPAILISVSFQSQKVTLDLKVLLVFSALSLSLLSYVYGISFEPQSLQPL